MYRKIIAFIIVIALCMAFVGCKEDNNNGDSATTTAAATVTTTATTIITTDTTIITTDTTTTDADENDTGKTESTSQPLLYKITDDKGGVLWLFGSIHIGREEFYPLPDYVMDAFEESDALAVEFDVVAFEKDTAGMVALLQKMCYLDGTTIKDHIDEKTYNAAVKILSDSGYYNMLMDYYIPSMWASLLDECAYMEIGIDMENGIDKYFINLSYDADKEIIDIESAEYQFGMLADFSPELQEYLLKQAVENYGKTDEIAAEIDKLVDVWVFGDATEFTELLLAEDDDITDPKEMALYEEYIEAMQTVRNKNMTEYADSAIKSGKEIFICVGAAHIVGDDGIANRLGELGYTVEIVK